jgi:hypothetical protein
VLEEGIQKQLIRKMIAILYAAFIPVKPEAMTTAKFLQTSEAREQALNAI